MVHDSLWKINTSDNSAAASSNLQECLIELKSWFSLNGLKQNDDKTEFIIFCPKKLNSLCDELSFVMGDCTVYPSDKVKNLGVLLDRNLDMGMHVSNISRSCYYQLRNISKIRRFLSDDACRAIVQATVVSRLDYANSLLYGIRGDLLNQLQRVQNTAARIITKTSKRAHITPILAQLHWLPVCKRIEYKILVIVFKALHGQTPPYIGSMIKHYMPSRVLRSADQFLLCIPKTKTKGFGNRSFNQVGPVLWNALPLKIRLSESLNIFKKLLKTYLFVQYFTWSPTASSYIYSVLSLCFMIIWLFFTVLLFLVHKP